MPSRSKRNAPSRRSHLPPPPLDSPSRPTDLLPSSDQEDSPPQPSVSDHSHSPSPAVFELDPPPSDPELGRQSALIRDYRHSPQLDPDLLSHPLGYAHHHSTYGPATSGSDIDDGPPSLSTSPPHPAPVRPYSVAHNAPTASALTKLESQDESASDDSSLSRSLGHIRSPLLARHSRSRYAHPNSDRDPSRSTLDSFSRTIRNYVPSSIPIPSAAPSPPRVSRPVSFGSFLPPSGGLPAPPPPQSPAVVRGRTPSGDAEHTWNGRGSDTVDPRQRLPWANQQQRTAADRDHDMPVFSLDDDVPEQGPHSSHRLGTRYPGIGNTEDVLWAGWDVLHDAEHARPRSILMLGYPTGLQLWDCSHLGTVSELLNLAGSHWGAVDYASILPDPPAPSSRQDAFRQKRPLIAFSSRTAHANGTTTDFVVYSLRTHDVVKRFPLIGLTSFAASSSFIVLSTSNLPSLHVLSSCTLDTLYTIPSASLVSFAYPASHPSFHSHLYPYSSFSTINTKPNTNDVPSSLDIDGSPDAQATLRPTYALSNRLLAYVSPSRPPASKPSPAQASSTTAHTSLPVPASGSSAPTTSLGLSLGGLTTGRGVSQSDLGNAAVKIGGSVLSGMKTLGGLAFSAARAGVSAAVSGELPAAGGGGAWFSKSAPAATGTPHPYQTAASQRRRQSLRMSPPVVSPLESTSTFPAPPQPAATSAPTTALSATGCTVLVVDLQPLLRGTAREPEPVAQFTFARPQALSALKFSADGTSLAMCAKDGHAVRVLQLRPAPRVLRRLAVAHPSAAADEDFPGKADGARRGSAPPPAEPDAHLVDSTQHVYTLRRGRTSAVVESMEWARDKLWFGLSTRKRTIHVFALHPLGGKPDGSSHFAGRVINPHELVSTSTELSPLVRIRLRPLPGDAPSPPCAFTFVRASDVVLPSSLLPPASVHFSASSSPSSVPSSGGLSKPVSPTQRPSRPTNYQDVLVFDPADGTLTLRRVFVERAAPRVVEAVVPGSIPVAGGMSISLPGMSTLSRSLGASPPSAGAGAAMGTGQSPRKRSGLTQMMERGTAEIAARESVVGTWALARGTDWPEVKQVVRPARVDGERAGRIARNDWLSRAELSTFSSSPRILPRPVYLSHQFSFHVLGEDYHALIRRAHLDVPSTKIEVRRPVEVSAFAAASSPGDNDAFVASSSLSSAHGGVPSSFDEPLASALAAPLHPLHPSPPVLPMLPNGVPGASASAGKALMHAAIPIRHVAAGISDGMSEGLGRLRRELGRARRVSHGQFSPRLGLHPDAPAAATPSVPLEFDEADEWDEFLHGARGASDAADAFVEADVLSRSASTGVGVPIGPGIDAHGDVDPIPIPIPMPGSAESGLSPSVSTPSSTTHMHVHMRMDTAVVPAEHDGDGEPRGWQGWGPEDQAAVEDAERFDDITVGFLDEEQASMRADAAKTKKRRAARKK